MRVSFPHFAGTLQGVDAEGNIKGGAKISPEVLAAAREKVQAGLPEDTVVLVSSQKDVMPKSILSGAKAEAGDYFVLNAEIAGGKGRSAVRFPVADYGQSPLTHNVNQSRAGEQFNILIDDIVVNGSP